MMIQAIKDLPHPEYIFDKRRTTSHKLAQSSVVGLKMRFRVAISDDEIDLKREKYAVLLTGFPVSEPGIPDGLVSTMLNRSNTGICASAKTMMTFLDATSCTDIIDACPKQGPYDKWSNGPSSEDQAIIDENLKLVLSCGYTLLVPAGGVARAGVRELAQETFSESYREFGKDAGLPLDNMLFTFVDAQGVRVLVLDDLRHPQLCSPGNTPHAVSFSEADKYDRAIDVFNLLERNFSSGQNICAAEPARASICRDCVRVGAANSDGKGMDLDSLKLMRNNELQGSYTTLFEDLPSFVQEKLVAVGVRSNDDFYEQLSAYQLPIDWDLARRLPSPLFMCLQLLGRAGAQASTATKPGERRGVHEKKGAEGELTMALEDRMNCYYVSRSTDQLVTAKERLKMTPYEYFRSFEQGAAVKGDRAYVRVSNGEIVSKSERLNMRPSEYRLITEGGSKLKIESCYTDLDGNLLNKEKRSGLDSRKVIHVTNGGARLKGKKRHTHSH